MSHNFSSSATLSTDNSIQPFSIHNLHTKTTFFPRNFHWELCSSAIFNLELSGKTTTSPLIAPTSTTKSTSLVTSLNVCPASPTKMQQISRENSVHFSQLEACLNTFNEWYQGGGVQLLGIFLWFVDNIDDGFSMFLIR